MQFSYTNTATPVKMSTTIQKAESDYFYAMFRYTDYSNGRVFDYAIFEKGSNRLMASDSNKDRAIVVEFAKYNWNRLNAIQ